MKLTLIATILFLVVLTSGLSIRMYYDKKKGEKEWSVWANLISAAGTLIVGIATIFIMFQENKIQKRLAKIEEVDHQPILVVKEVSLQSDGDVYGYSEFSIFNYGTIVKKISKVSADGFIHIRFNSEGNPKDSFVPIKDFYYHYSKTGALQGEIAHSYGSFKNHNMLNFVNNFYRFQSSLFDSSSIYVKLVTTYKIEYNDLLGEEKIVCFVGETETNVENYQSIHDKAFNDFNGKTFSLEDTTIDDVIRLLL